MLTKKIILNETGKSPSPHFLDVAHTKYVQVVDHSGFPCICFRNDQPCRSSDERLSIVCNDGLQTIKAKSKKPGQCRVLLFYSNPTEKNGNSQIKSELKIFLISNHQQRTCKQQSQERMNKDGK